MSDVIALKSVPAEEWEEASARALVALRAERMAPEFTGSLVRHELADGVAVVDARSGPHMLTRTPTLIRDSGADRVLLEINMYGGTEVAQHGRMARLRAGEGAFYDTRRPYRLNLPWENHSYLIEIPRRALAVSDRALEEAMARPIGRELPLYHLLRDYLEFVLPQLRTKPDVESRALVARTFADFARSLSRVVAEAAPASADESLLAALRATVANELSDPELTPATLAARHHVSIRTVHLAFSRAGLSPAAYIQQQRLALALRLLEDGQLRVVDVAMACGFRESSTFVRAFRRAWDMSPSEYRAARGIQRLH